MDMFWIESDLLDKVGTKKGYSLDNKWTYAIISAFCQKHIPISLREVRCDFNSLAFARASSKVVYDPYEASQLRLLTAR